MSGLKISSVLLPYRLTSQAGQTPGALAVADGVHQLTFAELNGRANQLARLLQTQGVGPESIVAVCLERSVELVVALLGVLKAGAAYLPIDPSYPTERIQWLLTDAGTAVCLTHSSLAVHLPAGSQSTALFLDQSDYILSLLSTENVQTPLQPDNLAYLIYTSGSTGQPKGAMITHGGLANYLDWALETYPVQTGGAPVHSSIGFDLTVTSLFLPLLAGQPVQLLPEGDTGQLLSQALTGPGGFGLVKITPAHLLLLNQLVPADQAAQATQSFVIGGEQLTAEQLAFWRTHAPQTRLFNEYGPTETVVGCCVYEVVPEDALNGAVPIGQPIAHTQLYVLDEAMQPVAPGEPGELYIGGAGVARGYWQRPSLTAAKFVPDPFSSEPGARLYRTGDLVRQRSDGNFEFLGRLDHQVKIRGYRIELGEIEAVLGQHEGVRETAVLVHELSGSKQLTAYFTAGSVVVPTAETLRDFLAQRLPEYMIPARFIRLDAMPLTVNGKIDRQALPAPDHVRPELSQPYVAPRTAAEETLAAIWSEVLGVAPIGIHDSFFGLGGDSILGIQIVAKARAAGLNLSQVQLFQQPTVAALADAEAVAETAVATPEPLLTPAEEARLQAKFGGRAEAAYPLSPLQEGILFHRLLHPDDDLYFEQPAFTLDGPLDADRLFAAWQQLVARHPILRTIFVWEGWERPLQIVLKNAPPRTQLLDWRYLPAAERGKRLSQLLVDNPAASLPLHNQPPHHLTLVRLGEQETRFVWAVHHIILDGWTESLLYRELFAIYEAMGRGETAVLPEPVPFETFIRWQRQQDRTAAEQFWRIRLADFAVATPLTIDLGKRSPRHGAQNTGELRRQLPDELYAALQQFGRRHGLTVGTLLQAAWALLLSRYSGEPDVLFGTMMSGRVPQLLGVDQMAGVLINPVPVRTQIDPTATVLPWLQTFQANLLALQAYETVPLAQVQSWSSVPGDLPLFESLLVLENYPRQRRAANGQLKIRDYFSYERTNYPLTLRLVPDDGLDVILVFDADRLAVTAVSRLFGHWCTLLAGLVMDGERPLAQLPLITDAEAHQLLVEWNTWGSDSTPTSCIHQEFERQAAQTPDAVAVTFDTDKLTYAELNAKANQLAHFLQQNGVQPDDLVALYLERSLEMVIAILAVLKAGGAYLPIDIAYPSERVAFMLEDARPVLLLTQEQGVAGSRWQVAGEDAQFTANHLPLTIRLDADWPQIAQQPTHNPVSAVRPSNRAYVIYTSGSTGQPKGVLISHYNVMRLFQATDDWYHFGPSDVWTLFHSYAFDFSVWEMWGALLYGGRLVVVPYLTSRSPHDFYHLLLDEGVTVLNQTPSAFRQLIQAEAETVSGNRSTVSGELALRFVIFGGEALELHTLQPWFDRHGDQKPQLINMYGITETTVHVTYRPITQQDVIQANGSVIGQAIPDLQLYILDPQQRPVPIGVPGEIYVGGAGVAVGYLNRPELTAVRFVPNPFETSRQGDKETRGQGDKVTWRQGDMERSTVTPSPGHPFTLSPGHPVTPSPLYRTGDLARWLPDGDIEYLGRIDQQVKIRGFRIELGEIEAALASHPAVQEVLVLAREDQPGEKRLVAYLVLAPAATATVSELRAFVQPRLPAYMIPAAFVLLDALPLTTNGKVDRRALPQPVAERPELARPFLPPRTRAEELLADIWSRVLNVTRVGIDDNYFELGGDSIRSLQVLAQASRAGLNFSLADLFNLQTISSLAEQMARIELGEAVAAALEIEPFGLAATADRAALPAGVEDAYPLSKLQAGMLFHSELAADTAVYHNVSSWHIEAPFVGELLATAVQQLAARHPVLRTSIDQTTYSQPLQLVWAKVVIPVAWTDLRHLSQTEQTAVIKRQIQQNVAEKFDWTRPPLLRFHFLQRSETTFQMIMAEHHAILDGWSVASLVTELFQTYRALLSGQPLTAEASVPYREFIAAEQASLASDSARVFWRELLDDSSISTVPRLPLPKPEGVLPETAVHQTMLSAEQVAQLNQVAQQAGVPLKSVLLAAHLKVLGTVSGRADVLTGLVMNGRPEQSGSERALGLFLNTVPFRQKLEPGSWLDLIRQTFATEKTVLPYRRFPLAEIQQMLGGQPLFEVPFNFLNFHIYDDLAGADVRILDEQFFGHASFELAVEAELHPASGTLALKLEYDPAQFGAPQIATLAGYFTRTLAALAAAPEAPHQTFSPLSQAELQQLLVEWNATTVPVPDRLVHDWVAQVADTMGERTAVFYQDQYLTYAELNAKANQLAHMLLANGVGPESVVAIYLNRSPEMVIAALAVLKAGGVYLPLDPTYPDDRLAFMLADARPQLVLTHSTLQDNLPSIVANRLCLDTEWDQVARHSDQNPPTAVTTDNAAYIIYTSGSTGQPKGVVVTHRGLPNLAQYLQRQFVVGPNSRVLQFAAFGFDASVAEIFMTLTSGAALVLADADDMLPGPELVALVQTHGVTVMTLPPSALALLDPADFPSLQTVVAAGEACSVAVMSRWAASCRFVNGYGPTEGTVAATTAVLTPRDTQVHIGRPIDNAQVYVLNADQLPVPLGTPGELYIGGLGIARGYLNRPELTRERFIANPFDKVTRGQGDKVTDHPFTPSPGHPVTSSRLYKTGDLVRYLPDGNLEFLGRVDHQVQLRGYRIELGEIEAALRRETAVQDALVMAQNVDGRGPQLVAYVVGQGLSPAELRTTLGRSLPGYMVPSAFELLARFPMTPNGKIDRQALPIPTVLASTEYVAPRSDVETVVANVWAELLQLPRVGIHDNFFELGGHSLLGTQLVARLRQMLRIELPLRALFDSPTVAKLADSILQSPNNPALVEKVAQLLIKLSQLSDAEAAALLSQRR